MIILDTNVISEVFRPRAAITVRDWMDSQLAESLYLCAPVMAELHFGIERLPEGAQKRWLRAQVDGLESNQFHDRVLPFDAAAASHYGSIAAARQRMGRPMGQMDGFIAAIALAVGAAVATRDVRGFADVGLSVINPFQYQGPA